jgi:hypothetical protein
MSAKIQHFLFKEDFMASKTSKDKRNPWEVDFVNVELSKEQKDMLRKWDMKYESTVDAISKLVDDGFKLSVWGDKAHDCCGATITTPKSTEGGRQKCLSARGPDFLGALKALCYKHLIVLDGVWDTLDNNSDPDSRWG